MTVYRYIELRKQGKNTTEILAEAREKKKGVTNPTQTK